MSLPPRNPIVRGVLLAIWVITLAILPWIWMRSVEAGITIAVLASLAGLWMVVMYLKWARELGKDK